MLLLRVLVYTKLDQLGKLESHSLSREWPAMWHSCVCTEDKREILSQPSNGLFVAGNIEDLLGLCNCTPHISMYTRNPNPKLKIGFKTSVLNINYRNIYWSQFFNQILIYLAGLMTLGPAAMVLAALKSRAASTTAAGPKVIKPAH